jgi:PPM family protein phosphatase
MKIEYFGKTDKGKVRKANEDCFAGEKIANGEYLFVVADGMGGHRAGDVASKLGTVTFLKFYKKLRKKKHDISNSMNRSLMRANLAILSKSSTDPKKRGMGTTLSAMVIADMKAYIVHVGDSRIYLIRDSKISQVTTDHTFVGKMVEEGRLTESEAREHPQKNILYMSLGARKSFDPEIFEEFALKEDDIFILCSDGLNNMVPDSILKEYALSFDPKESAEQLIKLANQNGGTDNITLLIIQINQNREPTKTEPIPVLKENIFRLIINSFKRLFKKRPSEEI